MSNIVDRNESTSKALSMVSVRLVKDAPLMSKKEILTPEDAIEVLGDYLCEMDREVFCIINLKTNGIPINCSICSVGTLDQAMVHPREILKCSILSNAANIIMMHNHPSGSLKPSKQDAMVTDQMIQACDILGIGVIDHVIVAGENKEFFSFREKDVLPVALHSYKTNYNEIIFSDTEEIGVAEENLVPAGTRNHR